ncbi:MAG: helix-turn-helix transcriptional regulator [Thermomicrobiales bacterium]
MTTGERIKQRREEKGIPAVELARRAEISKGYLSELERGHAARPSGAVLYKIANVLGTTVADLLGEEIRPANSAAPAALRALAKEEGLPEEDVRMLANIRFRGEQPRTEDDWRFLYESIRRSIGR